MRPPKIDNNKGLSPKKIAETHLAEYLADVKDVLSLFTQNAFDIYLHHAKNNNPFAQLIIGECYFQGLFVRKDYKQAVEYYTEASNNNLAEAIFRLAMCLRSGIGVTINPHKADTLFKRSVEPHKKHYEKTKDILFFYVLSEKRKFTPYPFFYSNNILESCPNCGASEGRHFDQADYNVCTDCNSRIYHSKNYNAPDEKDLIFYTFCKFYTINYPSGSVSCILTIAINRLTKESETQVTYNKLAEDESYRISFPLELTNTEKERLLDSKFIQTIIDTSQETQLSKEEKENKENATMSELVYDTMLIRFNNKTYGVEINYFYKNMDCTPVIPENLLTHNNLWNEDLLPQITDRINFIISNIKEINTPILDGSNIEF